MTASESSSIPEEKETGQTRFSGRCLVAEDSRVNQLVIQRKMGALGIDVTFVDDGQAAVEQAGTGAFDLIFMDIEMPIMDGYDATRVLREAGVTTPIVALTARTLKGDDVKCLDAGCNAYLAKPIDRDRLLEILTRYLTLASEHRDAAGPRDESGGTHEGGQAEPAKLTRAPGGGGVIIG